MPEPLTLEFGLPFDEAIAAAVARKVVLPTEYYGRVPLELRTAATTVSGLAGLDQIQRVIDSLTEAMRSGTSLGEWKRDMEGESWHLPPGRLETIFRTNVQTAYTAGHWRTFEANRARRPFLMWSAINDSRVRPTHLAMDGHIAPIDDPIWRVWHPPAGYNCRCSQISLTEAQARARGYGRQTLPTAQPDPGFEGGPPGSVLGGVEKAKRAAVPKAAMPAQAALAKREAELLQPGPQGPSVSAALTLPKGRGALSKALREAAQAVDEVHGDGALPKIPVAQSQATATVGKYSYYAARDEAHSITISRNSPHPLLTFAHEVGHFLDHKGWGGRGYSSALEAAAEPWRQAVLASLPVQRLVELRRSGRGDLRQLHYLTSWHELWARSYAQWVATRSGNQTMLADLTKIKTSPVEANRLSQWDSASFEPIAKAIDDLFALLGWRRP